MGTVGRDQPHRQELEPTRRSKKMCRKTEDAGETLGQDDNHARGCQKSCHFDQVRLQREPEQPYCGICQAVAGTWRSVFAKSLGPCDTKTPPSMLSCSSAFCLFIYYSMGSSTRLCQTEYVLNNAYTFLSSVFIVRSRIYKNI